MFNFKRLVFSLFACFGLFLAFNHFSTPTVEAANVDYNTTLAKSWGISKDYMTNYHNKLFSDKYKTMKSDVTNEYMTKTYAKHIRAQILLNWDHVYPSNINNNLTIHFDYDGDKEFHIVNSSGNYEVNMLVLTFIDSLAETGNMLEYERVTGKKVQPTWKVNGSNIDVYIPCVYYPKETRTYLAEALEDKIEMLTGKDYEVTFRTSKSENVQKIGGTISEDGMNNQFYSIGMPFDVTSTLSNFTSVDYYTPLVGLPGYKDNGKTYNYPAAIRVNCSFKEFVEGIDKYYVNQGTGYSQRNSLAMFMSELFYHPFIVRIVCDDYTISFDAKENLVIEPSGFYQEVIAFDSMDYREGY